MFKKILLSISLLFFFMNLFLSGAIPVNAKSVSMAFTPAEVRQGDPVMVQIDGVKNVSEIAKMTFGGKSIGIFMYQNKPTGIIGIDLNKKAGAYDVTLELTNGKTIKQKLTVILRDKIEKPLGIPEKLGGNTKASADKLVSTLNEDNKILLNTRTNKKSLWKEKFVPPLKNIYITAPYGNSRKTGEYSIPHKGVDYRAKEGTDVLAMNRGVVRLAQEFRNHGKTIVIDHGQGLLSYYLHLSKYNVKVGDVVELGQVIASSGATGYTLGAHLHFAVRINGISIDPVKFLELFK